MTERVPNPISEVADSVMPEASPRRKIQLLPLLDSRVNRRPSPNRDEIESLPQPDGIAPGVRFDYSYDELTCLASEVTPGEPADIKRVTRYALVWSGMKIDDDLLGWSTLDHGYRPGTRLPRVTLPVDSKRLSVRVVPDAWEGQFDTPFRLQKHPAGFVQISALDKDGTDTEIARPAMRFTTESVMTLAYLVNQSNGTKNITINPLQRCPQNCEFCCRGYHDMTAERKRELINLDPGEMARALTVKFPDISNWLEIHNINIVTGDFRSEEDILDYMRHYVIEMSNITAGQWNPVTHEHQNISVSSHLLRSQQGMELAKELGMKRFIHTVEMVDDTGRESVMHLGQRSGQPTSLDKGHSSFDEALQVLKAAADIFGNDNVEPVLVIGLDPFEHTKAAMDALKDMGISHISRALINVYDMNQFTLMPAPFEDAVKGMQYARDMFGSPHRKIVTNAHDPRELQPED